MVFSKGQNVGRYTRCISKSRAVGQRGFTSGNSRGSPGNSRLFKLPGKFAPVEEHTLSNLANYICNEQSSIEFRQIFS